MDHRRGNGAILMKKGTSKWSDLGRKTQAQLTDGDRVAIAAIIKLSVTIRTKVTMDEIFEGLLRDYEHILECEPLRELEK